jgi:hypothetical protein
MKDSRLGFDFQVRNLALKEGLSPLENLLRKKLPLFVQDVPDASRRRGRVGGRVLEEKVWTSRRPSTFGKVYLLG